MRQFSPQILFGGTRSTTSAKHVRLRSHVSLSIHPSFSLAFSRFLSLSLNHDHTCLPNQPRAQLQVLEFQDLDHVASAVQSAGEPSTGVALLDQYSIIVLGDLTRVRQERANTKFGFAGGERSGEEVAHSKTQAPPHLVNGGHGMRLFHYSYPRETLSLSLLLSSLVLLLKVDRERERKRNREREREREREKERKAHLHYTNKPRSTIFLRYTRAELFSSRQAARDHVVWGWCGKASRERTPPVPW